jgi:hypothetical protein
MTEWRATTEAEIVELASRLQSFDWSWQMADVPRLAAAFGWQVQSSRQDWVMLDDGFGMGSGFVRGSDGQVEDIELQVTEVIPATFRRSFDLS